jgi:drug/metabolite transporter (DMT)-like permease
MTVSEVSTPPKAKLNLTTVANRRTGFLLVVFAAALYAILPSILRTIYATSDFKPTDVAIWRYLLAVPMIWAVYMAQRQFTADTALVRHKGTPVTLPRLLFLGFLYSLSVLLAFFALERLPVGVFTLLFYTYPSMVAVLSIFTGNSLSRFGWLALVLTLIGAMLTISDTSGGQIEPVGVVLGILHAVSVAVYFMVTGRLLGQSSDAIRNTSWILLGTLGTLLLCIPFFGFQMPPTLQTWLGLFALAGLCTGLPIFALNRGIQKIGPAQAAIAGTIEPVFAMGVALVLLAEPILPLQWVGTAFIIAAVILLQLRPAKA